MSLDVKALEVGYRLEWVEQGPPSTSCIKTKKLTPTYRLL